MEIYEADVAIVGAGGAGLRAAIAAASADPSLKIALISKVYPMRSHTVAAEDAFAAAGKRPTLTEEQRLALEHLTIWSGSIQCLEGLAGTG